MCNAPFLVREDRVNDVTVMKQGQGRVTLDVRKLQKLKGQETHEENGSLMFKVKNCVTMEFLGNFGFERVLVYFRVLEIVSQLTNSDFIYK